MSDDEPVVGGRPLSSLKVVELRDELGKHGLSKIGNKNALCDRLKEFLLGKTPYTGSDTLEESHSDDMKHEETSSANPFVAEYLAKQQAALREARKDADAVRRAASGDDESSASEGTVREVLKGSRDRSAATDSESSEHSLSSPLGDKRSEKKATMKAEGDEFENKVDEHEEAEICESVKREVVDVPDVHKLRECDDGRHRENRKPKCDAQEDRLSDSGSGVSECNGDEVVDFEGCKEDVKICDTGVSSGSDEESSCGDRMSSGASRCSDSSERTEVMEFSFDHDFSREGSVSRESLNRTSTEKVGGTVVVSKFGSLERNERQHRWKDYTRNEGESFDYNLNEEKEKMEELDYEELVQSAGADEEIDEPSSRKTIVDIKAIKDELSQEAWSSVESSHSTDRKVKEDMKFEELTEDGFVRLGSLSPSRYPTSNVIIIRQLTRPFTVRQLQLLLNKFGLIPDDGFWIDDIKSMCIVKYSCIEEAVSARGRLHNIVWPHGSPRVLKVDYADEARLKRQMKNEGYEAASPAKGPAVQLSSSPVHPTSSQDRHHVSPHDGKNQSKDREEDRSRRRRRRSSSPGGGDEKRARRNSPWCDSRAVRDSSEKSEMDKRVKTADDLFMKTKSQPAIYYLPLTEEQIAQRIQRSETDDQKKRASNGSSRVIDKKKNSVERSSWREKVSSKPIPSSPVRSARNHSPIIPSARRSRSRSLCRHR